MPSSPHSSQHPPVLGRRRAFGAALASIGTAASVGLHAPRARAEGPGTARRTLTAQTTEGPYFLDGMPLRADIAEGLPGVPIEVRIEVLNLAGQALPELRVDLWQCDAQGLYSGFNGQGDDRSQGLLGQRFLRGGQLTGADGTAVFRSIYPGWYAGRTTHIHFKVGQAARTMLTSQFFLPDALSEFLYTRQPDYQRAALRNVLNSSDGIALRAGDTVVGSVREAPDRYVLSLAAVVDPLANPPIHRPGPGGGPPPGARGPGGPPPGFGGTPPLKAPEGAGRVQALLPASRPR